MKWNTAMNSNRFSALACGLILALATSVLVVMGSLARAVQHAQIYL
jgi:tetrahydromethanopterin S-methyltransferase subunit F